MSCSYNKKTGEKIDWDAYSDKRYTLNFEDFKSMVIYLNSAGRAMSALYYKHSDPDWGDEVFDAYMIYMKKLQDKFPELEHYMSIMNEVGK